MSNLIDTSVPEEDDLFMGHSDETRGAAREDEVSSSATSPFDYDLPVKHDLFGQAIKETQESFPPPNMDVHGDLLNMATTMDEIKPVKEEAPREVKPPPPTPVEAEVKPQQQQPKQEAKQESKESKQPQGKKEETNKGKSKSSPKKVCPADDGSCSFLTNNPHIAHLIFWRDLKMSGIVFTAGLVLLLSLACCSIISVIANGSLLILGSTLVYRIYRNIMQAVQKTDEGHPFKKYLEMDIIASEEKVHQVVDRVLEHLNVVLSRMKSIFLVEDIVDSIKYFVIFWCLTYVGSWFNGITLVTLIYIGLFSIPKLYEMNKAQIDTHLALVRTQVQGVWSQITTKLPFLASRKEKSQ